MSRYSRWSTLLWLTGWLPPLSAQAVPSRYALTTQDVLRCVRAVGAIENPTAVTLQAAPTTAVPGPPLQILEVIPAGSASLQLRMGCRVSGQCLPFLTRLWWNNSIDASTAEAIFHSSSTVHQPIRQTGQNVLHVGQHATLLLEDEHMHISLPVICIDTGAPGSKVRAASLDRKQVYQGTVTEAGEIRGLLQ